jgi:hypothetical protein
LILNPLDPDCYKIVWFIFVDLTKGSTTVLD